MGLFDGFGRPPEESAPVARVDFSGFGTPPDEHIPVGDGSISVVDGDTLEVGGERIRVNAIDAPESSLPTGQLAKNRLAQLLNSGEIGIHREGKDPYGRTVATVTVNGEDIGPALIAGAGARNTGYQNKYSKQAQDVNDRYKLGLLDPDEQAAEAATKPYIPDQFALPLRKPSNFSRGLESGVNQMQATLYGLASLAGDALGNEALRDFGNRGYARNQKEAEATAPDVTSLKDIHDTGDFFDWAAGALGQAVPSLATSVAGGGVGAAVGKKVVAKVLEKKLGDFAEKQLIEGGISKEIAERAVARVMASAGTQQRLFKAAKFGATTGVATQSAATQAGDIQGELQQAGISAPGTALAAGAAAGALDALPAHKLIEDLFPGMDHALAKSFVQGVAKSLGVQTLLEGSTEAAQELIAITARALHDPNFKITDPQQLERIADAGAAGALVGFVGGLAGGVSQGMRAKGTTDGKERTAGADTGATASPGTRGDATGDDEQRLSAVPAAGSTAAGGAQGGEHAGRSAAAAPGTQQAAAGGVETRGFNAPPAVEEADPERTVAKFTVDSGALPDRVLHGQHGSSAIIRGGERVSGNVRPYTTEAAAAKEAARLSAEYPQSTFQVKEHGDGFVIERDDGPDVETVFDARSGSHIPRPDFIRARMRDALVAAKGGVDRFGVRQKGNADPRIEGRFPFRDGSGKVRRLAMPEVTKLGMDLDVEGKKLPLGQRIARGVSEGVQAITEGGQFDFDWNHLKDDTIVYQDKDHTVTWGQVREGVKQAARRETQATIADPGEDFDPSEIQQTQGAEGEHDPALSMQETEAEQAANSARDRAPGRRNEQAARKQELLAVRRGRVTSYTDEADAQLVADLVKVAGLENQFWITDKDSVDRLIATLDDPALAEALRETAERDPAGAVHFSGDHVVIYVSPRLRGRSPANRVAVLGHEVGHVVSRVYYDRLADNMKQKLRDAHERSGEPDFEEWKANQFVSWSVRKRTPKDAVQSFFKRVGAILKQMFDLLTGRFKLDETYEEFMDGVAEYARRGTGSLTSDVARHFESLGAVGSRYWVGLPPDVQHFTPPSLMVKPVREAVNQVLARFPKLLAGKEGAVGVMKEMHELITASLDGRMRRVKGADGKPNPFFVEIAKHFFLRPGEVGGETFYRGLRGARDRFGLRAREYIGDLTPDDEKALVAAALGDKDYSHLKGGKGLKRLFGELYEYMKQAGLPIRKIENFFPIQYKYDALIEKKNDFIKMVMEQTGATRKQAEKTYENILAKAKPSNLREYNGEKLDDELNMSPNPAVGNALYRKLWHSLKDKKAIVPYIETDLKTAVEKYIRSATKLAEYNRRFGMDMRKEKPGTQWEPNRKLNDLMTKAANVSGTRNADMQFLNQALDAYFGKVGMDMSPQLRKLMSNIMLYQNVRTLLFAVPASFVDLAGVAIRTGNVSLAFRGMMKSIKEAAKTHSDLKQMARTYGIISDSFNDYVLSGNFDDNYTTPFARKWSERFFTASGMHWWTNFTRTMSLGVGREFLLEHATRAARGEQDSIRRLAELGLTHQDVATWERAGRPTYGAKGYTFESKAAGYSKVSDEDLAAAEKVAQALRRFSDESVLRPDAAQRPKWASDPRWQLVWHLKSFMYSFQKTFLSRIWYEMSRDGAKTKEQLSTILPALMLLPIAALGLELRELVQYPDGEDPTDRMGAWEYLFTLMQRSGLFGLSQLAIDFNEAQNHNRIGLIGLMGPTFGQIEELLSTPPSHSIPRSIPIVAQFPWMRLAVQDYLQGEE